MKQPSHNSGFIALISAIIIAVLLLTITFMVSRAGLSNRFNILDADLKEQSSNLADACADTAIYSFSQSPTYNPVNQVVPIGTQYCTIISKQISGTQSTFDIQAIVNHAYTNLEVMVDANYNVIAWVEVPNF